MGGAAWAAIALTAHAHRIAAIWLGNGLWLGIVLPRPKRRWPGLLGAGLVGNLAANLIHGDGLAVGLLLSVCNGLEVLVSALGLARPGALELHRRGPFLRFLLIAVGLSPLLAAAIASAGLYALRGQAIGQNGLTWLIADALGVALVTPLVLKIGRRRLWRAFTAAPPAKTALLFAAPIGLAMLCFWQTRYPLLFLVPPTMGLAAAELGYAATTILVPVVGVIALVATEMGRGQFHLNAALSPEERLYMLQFFLLANVLISHWTAGVAAARRKAVRDLAELAKTLRVEASVDPLTGLANRRSFDTALARELASAGAGEGPLSLLLLDLDHFKKLNDTLGHNAGDACLCRVAEVLRRASRRGTELASRYGGEEFALLLPGTDAASAQRTAEALREAIARLTDAGEDGAVPVTASIGIATLESGRSLDPGLFVASADISLYEAKRAGRNCVHAARQTSPPRLRIVR